MKNQKIKKSPVNGITRKEAIKKAGKYTVFTAATMLAVLSPIQSQAQSPDSSPRSPREWRD